MTELRASSAMRLKLMTDSCSRIQAVLHLLCSETNQLLQGMAAVSRCSRLCGCWPEPVANVPVAGAAFSLRQLVHRSLTMSAAITCAMAGKEPVAVGEEKLFRHR